MDQAHIEKLRRFALAMGLIVLTWAVAGISLAAGATVTVLGIPFRVSRPELLPFGFAAAAVYGALRYHYYAIMLATSPYRLRRDLLDSLQVHDAKAGKAIRTYWGATHFKSTPWHADYAKVQVLAAELKNAFPKFVSGRVTTKILTERPYNDEGEEYSIYALELRIPVRCRVAALIQDLDYTSPAWFPLGATLVLLWQTL